MNEKFKQLNDMMLNNMNGIVATTKNVAPTSQKPQKIQTNNTQNETKQTFTQVVNKKKKKTVKTKPTVIGENIGATSTYPTKNTALYIVASKDDNVSTVQEVVKNSMKTVTCEVKIDDITKNDKLSTYRVQLLNTKLLMFREV